MQFGNETPFEDVLKYIKASTSKGKDDPGLPIYVDPLGLQEAEKTLQSTIVMDLEKVPIRTALRLMLRQLSLDYTIEDGILIISTPDQLAELVSRGPMFDLDHYNSVKEAEAAAEKARPNRGMSMMGSGMMSVPAR